MDHAEQKYRSPAPQDDRYRAIIWTNDRDGEALTILIAEGDANDVAAYAIAGHHPGTLDIAQAGRKMTEATAKSLNATWPNYLKYSR